MNNNNNVRIQKDKYGFDKIKLANLGLVKFKTSKEYSNILHQASNPDYPDAKIKHVTIKKENGAYYAVFNIECVHVHRRIIGSAPTNRNRYRLRQTRCSFKYTRGTNLVLTEETDKIIQYQKEMNHHTPGSIRYKEAKRLFNLWFTKLVKQKKRLLQQTDSFILLEIVVWWRFKMKILFHGNAINI